MTAADSAGLPRGITLEPWQWRIATWRDLPPLPAPGPPDFDRLEAVGRLRKVTGLTSNYYGAMPKWAAARLAPRLIPEEARFWLTAFLRAHEYENTDPLADALVGTPDENPANVEHLQKKLQENGGPVGSEIGAVLASLYTPAEYVEIVLGLKADPDLGIGRRIVEGFQRYVVPYLTPEEREALRTRVRPDLEAFVALNTPSWVPDIPGTTPRAALLAAALGGMDDLLGPLISAAQPGGVFSHHYYVVLWLPGVIFGLGSAERVEAEARRLDITVRTDQVSGWLAHTGWGALDHLTRTLSHAYGDLAQSVAREMVRALSGPEAAPFFLDIALKAGARRTVAQVAQKWLDAHPEAVAEGLLPLAGRAGKAGQEATRRLRALRGTKHEPLLARCIDAEPDAAQRARARAALLGESAGSAAVPVLDDATTPDWLKAGTAPAAPARKGGKAAAGPNPATLPPLLVGDRRLNEEQVGAALRALKQSTLEESHPLVAALREHADRTARDAFAWALFEWWQHAGMPAADKGYFFAPGLLGGDGCALKLGPVVVQWRRQAMQQRVAQGMEVLKVNGSDAALMALDGLAKQTRWDSMRQRAEEYLDAIAVGRGLSRAQLEDRMAPDCGLDARGTRAFDYGVRKFRLALGPDLKPVVREEGTGKVLPGLPKPTKKDDAALADKAQAEWNLLKKQVAEAAKFQANRLEQAMVAGRRWTPPEFEARLLRHPLMTNLARLLVWAAYGGDGAFRFTFRVTEDQTLADRDDAPVTLGDGVAEVGIAHPLHLSEAERKGWGELLTDYEVVPPFPQVSRPIYGLEADECDGTEITGRLRALRPLRGIALLSGLDKRGWTKGESGDGGTINGHFKPLPARQVTAVVEYEDGIYAGDVAGSDPQRLSRLFFYAGAVDPRPRDVKYAAVPLKGVDPVAVSEALYDLHAVMPKGD